jgi:hypothetical protein
MTRSRTKNDFQENQGRGKSGRVVQTWPESNFIGGRQWGILRHLEELALGGRVRGTRCIGVVISLYTSFPQPYLVFLPYTCFTTKLVLALRKMKNMFSVALMAKPRT